MNISSLPKNSLGKMLALLSLAIFFNSCNNWPEQQMKRVNGWINWNVLFDKELDSVQINKKLDTVVMYLDEYIRKYNDTAQSKIKLLPRREQKCICDPSLRNIDWDIEIDTSSGGTRVPPTPPTPPIVKGGVFENNEKIQNPYERNATATLVKRMELKLNVPTERDPIVAVMDTGIDTTLFQIKINDLLWRDIGSPTLYNFIYPGKADYLNDDHAGRHGSNVTSLILKQFTGRYSRLMILKAFDSLGAGTMFSVTCALSYAIQKKASVLNGSFGYEGREDRILSRYINIASRDTMAMVFAAGNASEPRQDLCQEPENPDNRLNSSKLFFPACFTDRYENVIAVTGLNSSLHPCYYQNYSNEYVSIGVKNSINCCSFQSAFGGDMSIEGSSFATPVIAGKIGNIIMGIRTKRNATAYIPVLMAANVPAITAAEISAVQPYIKNGNFIVQNE